MVILYYSDIHFLQIFTAPLFMFIVVKNGAQCCRRISDLLGCSYKRSVFGLGIFLANLFLWCLRHLPPSLQHFFCLPFFMCIMLYLYKHKTYIFVTH
jgi:hypothetical protein